MWIIDKKKIKEIEFLKLSLIILLHLIQIWIKILSMKIQGKEKTFLCIDNNPKSFKKSPKIIYVHLSFYGFEKINNLK